MLRRALAAAGSATLLTGLLVAGATGSAEAHPTYHPWGTTTSSDHSLRTGCHSYRYRYSITAPTEQWAAEIFVVNPNGRVITSGSLDAASDPDRGSLRMRVCRPSTVYGVHTIKMKITWQRDRVVTDGYVKPSTFRFSRP